jgi:hypothetical protein
MRFRKYEFVITADVEKMFRQIKVDPRDQDFHKTERIRSTKRLLLSDLNRIFDPLGFLSPVLIKRKIFLQQLCLLKIEWNKLLPTDN